MGVLAEIKAISAQETNIQSAAIGTRVVVCPEKFVMRTDMKKRRMKLIIEGTTTWITGEKKQTLENLRKIFDLSTHAHIFMSLTKPLGTPL